MPLRRRFLRAAGVALTGVGAAACRPVARPDGAAARAQRAATPVTLELWLPGRQADADALAPLHEQFAQETPGVAGVAVALQTNEGLMEAATAALAAGTPPDVARLKEYRLADLGARGALLPLDAHVAADAAVRLADFTPQSVDGSRAPVPPEQVRGGSGPCWDCRTATNWSSSTGTRTWWRPPAAIRRARRRPGTRCAGRPAPSSPPGRRRSAPARRTWRGPARRARWGVQFYEFSLREQTYCWFTEWVWRAGGEVWAAQGRDRTRATLDTPAAGRALQFLVDLLHGDRTAVPPGTPVPELIATVAQGRVGYWMTTANAALTYARTAPGLRFGVGPLPADRRAAHQLQHNALAVFKPSRRPDLAYRLVGFRSREDVQARWAAEGAWLPVRPALWRRPPFGRDPLWQALGAVVHAPGNRPKPVVPEWDAFTGVVLPHVLAAWRGETPPRQALRAAERAANTHLASDRSRSR